MFCGFIPPSTSNLTSFEHSSIIVRMSVIFGRTDSMNFWPPNPGLTDINKAKSKSFIYFFTYVRSSAGLTAKPTLQPSSFIRAIELSKSSEASG